MKFNTASGKVVSLDEIMDDIFELVTADGFDRSSIIVGTDAQVHGRRRQRYTKYSTVIVVLQGGDPSKTMDEFGERIEHISGQRRFWVTSETVQEKIGIKERLLNEVAKVVEVVTLLRDRGIEGLVDPGDFEVHLDIGHHGRSREVIAQCTGWIEGIGLKPVIKPDAYVATHVADHCVRSK